MIGQLFTTILVEPLFNVLVFFYNTIAFGDLGIAIILLTTAIRLVLWPLSGKALRAQRSLQELQPKIKEIQQKFKDQKEKQAQALMELYRENKVNPFGGCLPILIQIPILIALYIVFLNGLNPDYLSRLYGFVSNPGVIEPSFLGFLDLASPSIPLAVLAGALQFIQSKMALSKVKLPGAPKQSDEMMTQIISKQTLYVLPALTVVISFRLPAGLPLYWAWSTIFTIAQQFAIMTRRGRSEGTDKNPSK